MKLLEMKLFNLPSEHVPAVIGEVLKAEYMLVWAYHDADNVREFAIRVSRFPWHWQWTQYAGGIWKRSC